MQQEQGPSLHVALPREGGELPAGRGQGRRQCQQRTRPASWGCCSQGGEPMRPVQVPHTDVDSAVRFRETSGGGCVVKSEQTWKHTGACWEPGGVFGRTDKHLPAAMPALWAKGLCPQGCGSRHSSASPSPQTSCCFTEPLTRLLTRPKARGACRFPHLGRLSFMSNFPVSLVITIWGWI